MFLVDTHCTHHPPFPPSPVPGIWGGCFKCIATNLYVPFWSGGVQPPNQGKCQGECRGSCARNPALWHQMVQSCETRHSLRASFNYTARVNLHTLTHNCSSPLRSVGYFRPSESALFIREPLFSPSKIGSSLETSINNHP